MNPTRCLLKRTPLLTLMLIISLLCSSVPVPHVSATAHPLVSVLPDENGNSEHFQVAGTYTMTDSNEPNGPHYFWLDTTSGDELILNDDGEENISLPEGFDFRYNGRAIDTLRVGNNGAVLAGATSGDIPFDNHPLDEATGSENLIAPFWDDLDNTQGNVSYATVGETPYRRFVIAWNDRSHYSTIDDAGTITFQLVLYEETNNIKFQYQDVQFGNAGWDAGASASVGIRGTGMDAKTYLDPLQNQLAICFQHPDAAEPCDSMPIEGISISGPSIGEVSNTYGKPSYTFHATVEPPTFMRPVTYTWSESGQPIGDIYTDSSYDTITHSWDTTGMKTLEVWATNARREAATATHMIEIVGPDEPPRVMFGEETATIAESDGVASIPVRLVPATPNEVSVTCVSANGTATAIDGSGGDDFLPVEETLTFTPGETEQSCNVTLYNDTDHEDDETFSLKLQEPVNATVGTPPATTVTITDNDPKSFVSFTTTTFTETEGVGEATIAVTLSESLSIPVTVDYTTADRSARSVSDYMAVQGTLTFPPGETRLEFTVPITADQTVEGDETLYLELSNVRGGPLLGKRSQATLTIQDVLPPATADQSILYFSTARYRAYEGKKNESVIPVKRSGNLDQEVQVDVATFAGTAIAGRDFGRVFETLVFPPGVETLTVTIPITNDLNIEEGDETVLLALNNPSSGAELGTQQTAILTIVDQDTPPVGTLQFATDSYVVSEGAGSVSVTVNRAGRTSGTVTVILTTSDILATAGSDYTPRQHLLLSFAPGENEQTLSIPITDDGEKEGDETFEITLSEPHNSNLGAQQSAVVTIVDNNRHASGTVQFRSDTFYVDEAGDKATILIDRVGGSEGEITVDYATVDGTAVGGVDYLRTAGRLTFREGVTSRSFVVPILGNDSPGERPETVLLTLGNSAGAPLPQELSSGGPGTLQQTDPITPVRGSQYQAILLLNDGHYNQSGTVHFESSMGTFDEALGGVTIPVVRDDGITGRITVKVSISDHGNATEGLDYTLDTRELVFEETVKRKTISVFIEDDKVPEDNESFALKLEKASEADGVVIGSPHLVELTIEDNDSPEPVSCDSSLLTELTVSSSFLAPPTQVVFFQAAILDPSKQPPEPVPGCKNVEVRFQYGNTIQQLTDEANNGLYRGFYPFFHLGDDTPIEVSLLVDGESTGDTQTLTWNHHPELLVLTDWEALYDEFVDTGMQPQENLDLVNNTHDFFDVMERIRQYAQDHNGIVIDLTQTIQRDYGYWANYTDLPYAFDGEELAETKHRRAKGLLIDQAINYLCGHTGNTLKYVAIIGDDQVVPFYRVPDPTDWYTTFSDNPEYEEYESLEKTYPDRLSPRGAHENPVLEDAQQGYIMSDVPYSICAYQQIEPSDWSTFNPDTNLNQKPEPTMGIGRIFASRPNKLIEAIDRYEQPLSMKPGMSSASIFVTEYPEDRFLAMTIRSVAERALEWFQGKMDVFISVKEFPERAWQSDMLVQSLSKQNFVSLWGHATHKQFPIVPDEDIAYKLQAYVVYEDMQQVKLSHPTLFIGLGCNMGLSTSDYPDLVKEPDNEVFRAAPDGTVVHSHFRALVNPLLDEGTTIFIPSSASYTYAKEYDESHLQEFMVKLLVQGLLKDDTTGTIGDVWKDIYPSYHTSDPIIVENNNPTSFLFHLAGAYGMVLYGLPTQPLTPDPEDDSPDCEIVSVTSASLSQAEPETSKIQFEMDIPYIHRQLQDDGSTLFSVLNGGTYMMPGGGSPLPVVARSLMLPEHMVMTHVDMSIEESSTLTEAVTLPPVETRSTNGDVVPTIHDLPPLYPQQIYTYTVTPLKSGSLLTFKVVPMQYVQATGQVRLYHKLRFTIELLDVERRTNRPSSGTSLSQASGSLLSPKFWGEAIDLDETVSINFSARMYPKIINEAQQSQSAELLWVVRDPSGEVVGSGNYLMDDLAPGITSLSCELDTEGWEPGTKHLSVYLQQDDDTVRSHNQSFLAQGTDLYELSPVKVITQTEQGQKTREAIWNLTVYDEEGWPVPGLSQDNFTVTLDPSTLMGLLTTVFTTPARLQVAETADQSGEYEVRFSLVWVEAGSHMARVQVTYTTEDGQERTGWRDWVLSVPDGPPPWRVYLPYVGYTPPGVCTNLPPGGGSCEDPPVTIDPPENNYEEYK